MFDITVRTQPSYRVSIFEDDIATTMQAATGMLGQKVAIVSDDNVAPRYAASIAADIADKEIVHIVVPAGEPSKSATQYIRILNCLAAAHFTRRDTVVALGGGVVGDLAGFVASTYMRGIAFINIPTSLLAMVDSAVGGKTAINIDYGKNLCGTFYQPRWVGINTAFLRSLPHREALCGWGEILKYVFLSNTITQTDLEGDVTPQLIAKCVQIKADIVSEDEREAGQRKLLNLGHTIGHAIERLSGFELSHGECVAKGLRAALDISRKHLGLPDEQYLRAAAIIACKGHDLSIPYTGEQLYQELLSDKKSGGDGTDMVLINGRLQAEIVHLPYQLIHDYLV